MKRFLAVLITIATMLVLFPINPSVKAAGLVTQKFDLGGKGAASGYTGVSATEAYDDKKGYGFGQLSLVSNVDGGGTGALSDAVHFDGANGSFKVKLSKGVYKITVTTGKCESTTISAEGVSQLFFLTGTNATDSFTIPVTDGYLNIYATSGGGGVYSLCTVVIEQQSTETTTKPTIWVCGDSTVASYYNVSDTAKRGWGQFLCDYVDTNKYDVRNISASGMRSWNLKKSLFPTVEAYGKKGDILLLAIGINDYIDAYKAADNGTKPLDNSGYISDMTSMIRTAKSQGMTVYLVKQQGNRSDVKSYPLIDKKWFSDEMDQLAKSENVKTLDMFHPWLRFLLCKGVVASLNYYPSSEDLHPNKEGAMILAQMVAEALFPSYKEPWSVTESWPDNGTPTEVYETEVSGGVIKNPHKGYVMTVTNPLMLYEGQHPYGIGGSKDNHAWDVVTVVSDVLFWEDLNPSEGIYNWDEIDTMLEACEQAGMTYGMRIIPYTTGRGSDDNYGAGYDYVPDWVYANGAQRDLVEYTHDGKTVQIKVPKWDDPKYIAAYKKFIAALAERYNGDPRVEYFEIRVFGNMGEGHTGEFVGDNKLPSLDIQKDMLSYIASKFTKTTCSVFVDFRELYDYANSLGFAKRNNGLILAKNTEWELVPTYECNNIVMADNHGPYADILNPKGKEYVPWTETRYRESINIAHLSIFALDQDGFASYNFYLAQKPLVDEMCNKLGYNYTVTKAERYGNKLVVSIKNTGLAPSFFDIDLCAEITDAEGNKISNFGSPVLIEKGSFHDGSEKVFVFENDGEIPSGSTICLAMYDRDNYLVQGKDPTIKFDNKNNLENNRLKLVVTWSASSGNTTTPSPTGKPSGSPSAKPTAKPTGTPSTKPTGTPTTNPTGKPSSSGNGTAAEEETLSFEDFVERLYVVALGRQSEPEGKAFWCEHVGNGDLTGAECANEFLLSKEFNDRNLNDEQFLMVLYKTFFDRDAKDDPDGFNFWMNSLKTEGRDKVVDGFINSTEWCNICASYGVRSGATRAKATIASFNAIAFATRLYTECLGRDPEEEGLKFWSLGLTNQELSGTQAAKEFFYSAEFLNANYNDEEYINRMYKTFMGRDPEAEGKAFWLSELKNGVTRDEVFNFFSTCPEFTEICKEYAIQR